MSSATGTATLTEWLLACFDEDEEAVIMAPSLPFTPRQMLADIAAKRRVVERFAGAYPHPEWGCDGSCLGDPSAHWVDVNGADTLLDLANIYVDRPGYREWRPEA